MVIFVDASYKEAWNGPSVSLTHHNRIAERPRVHQSSVRLIVPCCVLYVLVYGIGVPDGEAPYASGLAIAGQDYCLLVKCLGPWIAATSGSGLPVKDLPLAAGVKFASRVPEIWREGLGQAGRPSGPSYFHLSEDSAFPTNLVQGYGTQGPMTFQ